MKLLKIVSLATLSSALALGAASAQGKKWDTVKIATEGAYAPWNFTSAGGKLEGFEIDLANELCTRMKAKCEIVAQDWDGIIPALTAKKYDAIMAGMNATDERRKVIDFSTPYAVGPNGYLVEKSSPLAKMPGTGKVFDLVKQKAEAQKAIDEVKPLLKGKTVGVQVATNHANFASQYLKGAAEIREYKTTEQHDLDLAAGRLDAVLADQTALSGDEGQAGIQGLRDRRAGPHRRRPRRRRQRRPAPGRPGPEEDVRRGDRRGQGRRDDQEALREVVQARHHPEELRRSPLHSKGAAGLRPFWCPVPRRGNRHKSRLIGRVGTCAPAAFAC